MMDYEICKVPRHRADIVRHKDSTERRGKSQNIGILHPFRNTILRKFEIDIGLAPENASNNILIKVLVREETDLQEDLGGASSLASRTFSERLGGSRSRGAKLLINEQLWLTPLNVLKIVIPIVDGGHQTLGHFSVGRTLIKGR